jgi:hypothetical protein
LLRFDIDNFWGIFTHADILLLIDYLNCQTNMEVAVKAKIKNGFPPKICQRCGLEFEWRKKWARDWAQVKYCSERCKRG